MIERQRMVIATMIVKAFDEQEAHAEADRRLSPVLREWFNDPALNRLIPDAGYVNGSLLWWTIRVAGTQILIKGE